MTPVSIPTRPQLVNGSWMSSWYDDSGKRRWRSFGSAAKVTREDATDRYCEWLPQQRSDATIRNAEPKSVAEVCAAFMVHAKVYYRKSDGTCTSEVKNFHQATAVLCDRWGQAKARKLAAPVLLECQQRMIGAGLARTTINARIARLRHLVRWAHVRGMVPAEAVVSCNAVRCLLAGRSMARESDPVRAVPVAHVHAVLPHVTRQIAAMIQVQLYSGCRPGEVCIMRVTDLDTTGKVWIYRPADWKTKWRKIPRLIYLGPKAQQAVEPFLRPKLGAWMFDPREAAMQVRAAKMRGEVAPKVPRRIGEHYTVRTYSEAIERACIVAGVPHWSPGQLRHTAATELRRRFGREGARLLLGHESVDMTDHYGDRDMAEARRIAARAG